MATIRSLVSHWAKTATKQTWVSYQNVEPVQQYRLKSLLSSVIGPLYDKAISPVPISQDDLTAKQDPSFYPDISTNSTKQNQPLGIHFTYQNPIESELSLDGYAKYQAPSNNGDDIFARRMWTGGQMSFKQDIPINTILKCTEMIKSVRYLSKLCFVDIQRKFTDELGTTEYLTENRMLVYTNEKYQPVDIASSSNDIDNENYDENLIGSVNLNSTHNFRFSALTYNAHKIHYDLQYCLSEGLEGPIISGPFLITIVLNLFKSVHSNKKIISVIYKNRRPVYEDKEINISYITKNKTGYKVKVESEGALIVDIDIIVSS